MKHINNGKCPRCAKILHAFPGFEPSLEQWFLDFQKSFPEAHVSSAGRGKEEQEKAFKTGRSKARWGESPHNFNLALDIFRLTLNGAQFDAVWYRDVLAPAVAKNPSLTWGGNWKRFRDMPHVEITNWKDLVKQLVE